MLNNNSLYKILDKLDDAIIIVDSNQKIIFQNSYAIEIFENDFSSQIITNLIREPLILDKLEETIKTGEETSVRYSKKMTLHSSSNELHYDVLIYKEEKQETEECFVIILKNVTVSRNLEKVKTSFVANVSHELKTPLSTILGFIETIRTTAKDDNESKEEFLKIINDESLRMDRLIDDLLLVSKIESNEHLHPTKKVDIGECVKRVSINLEKKLAKKNMKVSTKVQSDHLNVLGNEDELIQLFSNLIENSFKYGNPDSEINIYMSKEANENIDDKVNLFSNSYIKIKIEDESDGIPEKYIHRLTERFFRVDKARSKSIDGTGLGLTIVKHILNKHRGKIDISSEINVGSVFTVQIPESPIS